MAHALVIRLPRPQRTSGHRRMTLHSGPPRSGGSSVTVPYAPVENEYSGWAPQYAEVNRPGLPPLVLRSNEPLLKQRFDLILAHPDPQNTSCNGIHRQIEGIVRSNRPVYISNGPGLGLPWRVTEMSTRVTARQEGTNLPTRMTVSISMTQAIDAPPAPRARRSVR